MTRWPGLVFPISICLSAVAAALLPHLLVPLCAAAGLALATDARIRSRFFAHLRGPLAIGLGILLVWAGVSTLWSPSIGGGLLLALQLAGVMLAGALMVAAAECLDGESRDRALVALCFFGPIFLVLVLSELLTGGVIAQALRSRPITSFNEVIYDRAAAIGAVLAWPVAYALWRRLGRLAAIFFLILIAAALFELEMTAARLAFFVGGLAFLTSFWKPRAVIRGLSIALLAAILVLPPVVIATGIADRFPAIADKLAETNTSSKHRLFIAQFVLNNIAERPIIGHGFDASRNLPGGQTPSVGGQPVLPLHPHDAILQVWLELGAVGALIAAFIVALVLHAIDGLSPRREVAAAACASFAAFITMAVMSYGIWQNWWLMTAWIAATFMALTAKLQPE
ncbi:MAG: O-antigen ligase family protein [Alphaproteobacteria bacterium]